MNGSSLLFRPFILFARAACHRVGAPVGLGLVLIWVSTLFPAPAAAQTLNWSTDVGSVPAAGGSNLLIATGTYQLIPSIRVDPAWKLVKVAGCLAFLCL